jgi:hypothetical protein
MATDLGFLLLFVTVSPRLSFGVWRVRVPFPAPTPRYFWTFCILMRKFGIAFTSLMFNKNPEFQVRL